MSSLSNAIQIGRSSLAAAQAALEVTGNNISNVNTPGYTRESIQLTTSDPLQSSPGQFYGTGVQIGKISRAVDETLNSTLRSATSDQNAADALNTALGQLQSTLGALGSNDLSAKATSFFNGFSTLANNVQDSGQRSVAIQNGVSLAGKIQDLRSSLSTLRDNTDTQIQTNVKSANTLIQEIASLNGQIGTSEAGQGGNNTLHDQRDQALNDLSKLVDIRSVDQGNGQINVLIGNVPVVQGNTARPIGTQKTSTNGLSSSSVIFTDNGDPVPLSSGSIAGLINARDTALTPAIQTIDTFASALIQTVNSISSQGQGLSNFSNVTGTTQVLNTTAPLNSALTTTGLPSSPTNGTFTITEQDASTGKSTSRQIAVNLSGVGTQDSLTTLAAKITDANITASVTTGGQLQIKANNSNTTFSFSDDSSGTLAALGVNTYFTGSNASNIGVNQALINNPTLLATGKDNIAGSNKNASALALGFTATSSVLGNTSLKDYYTTYIGNVASSGKTASDNLDAQKAITSSVSAQQASFSGVDLNEEAINLTQYQRAFQGSAQLITTINSLFDALFAIGR